MTAHSNPVLCLANHIQKFSDGGREDFLQQEMLRTGDPVRSPSGDCGIVALVHAAFLPPTGESYRKARGKLEAAALTEFFNQKRPTESLPRYWLRRGVYLIRPPVTDPMHTTHSHAMERCLIGLGYKVIYPNPSGRWFCICDKQSTFVLDIHVGDGHMMTVHDGVVFTSYSYNPADTRVINVYALPPTRPEGSRIEENTTTQ